MASVGRVVSRVAGLAVVDETEVEHLDEVVVIVLLEQEDVARLDVAVDDAERVSFAQRASHLLGDVDGPIRRQTPALLELFGERSAVEVLHRDEAPVRRSRRSRRS